MVSEKEKKVAPKFSDKIQNRQATVLVLNVKGMLSYLTVEGNAAARRHHSAIFQELTLLCKAGKGLCDMFQGDHLHCSFNALMNCGTHKLQACLSALKASQLSANSGGDPVVITAGISTGKCACGNFGFDGMKKFTVFGAAVNLANLFERFCADGAVGRECANLVDHNIELDVKMACNTLLQDVISWPKVRGGKDIRVYTVVSQVEVADCDEWMYELEQAAKSNPFNVWNEATILAFKGNLTEAKTCLEQGLRAINIKQEVAHFTEQVEERINLCEEGTALAPKTYAESFLH